MPNNSPPNFAIFALPQLSEFWDLHKGNIHSAVLREYANWLANKKNEKIII